MHLAVSFGRIELSRWLVVHSASFLDNHRNHLTYRYFEKVYCKKVHTAMSKGIVGSFWQSLSIFSGNIFGCSSAMFGNLLKSLEILRKSSEDVWKHLYDYRTTFSKMVGNLRKIIKNLVVSRFIK